MTLEATEAGFGMGIIVDTPFREMVGVNDVGFDAGNEVDSGVGMSWAVVWRVAPTAGLEVGWSSVAAGEASARHTQGWLGEHGVLVDS